MFQPLRKGTGVDETRDHVDRIVFCLCANSHSGHRTVLREEGSQNCLNCSKQHQMGPDFLAEREKSRVL